MKNTNLSGWKGIVLAGGAGSRLYPITMATSKQLLPIFDKPMIYYPLSILMRGGIRDILIISTPSDLPKFKEILGDGSKLGVKFAYAEQAAPKGIAESFIIGADFIDGDNTCLILGDNLFYGDMDFVRKALKREKGATVFAYPVNDPQRYGVVQMNKNGKAISIEEKPKEPKSRLAVTGMYCFDNRVVEIAQTTAPSKRGELEITDVIKRYMKMDELHVEMLCRGMAWLDTGTPQSLLDAANFVANIENRQGLKIGCLEEVAFHQGYINADQLRQCAEDYRGNEYGRYLKTIVDEHTNSE